MRSVQEALQEQLAASHSVPARKSNIDAHQKKVCHRLAIKSAVRSVRGDSGRFQHLLRSRLEFRGAPDISPASEIQAKPSREVIWLKPLFRHVKLVETFSPLVAAGPRISSSCWL